MANTPFVRPIFAGSTVTPRSVAFAWQPSLGLSRNFVFAGGDPKVCTARPRSCITACYAFVWLQANSLKF